MLVTSQPVYTDLKYKFPNRLLLCFLLSFITDWQKKTFKSIYA